MFIAYPAGSGRGGLAGILPQHENDEEAVEVVEVVEAIVKAPPLITKAKVTGQTTKAVMVTNLPNSQTSFFNLQYGYSG